MKFSDLNPSNENYNFSIDILEKVFLEKLKQPFSNPTIFKVLSGAKGFGKTYLICLLALFFVCNFSDYNALLSRYTYKSSRESYKKTISKVINDLEKHGVTIKQAIEEKEIKTHDSDNKCDFIFPNKRVINIVGFDNSANWEGIPAEVGEWGLFAIDEVIPLKEKIVDEEEYNYKLFNMLTQIVRGKNLSTCSEPLEELKNNNFQLYKTHLVIFGFNNHDTSHTIYQNFVHEIIPLTDKRKKQLNSDGITFDIRPDYLNLGATVIRGTTKINEHNLNPMVMQMGEGIRELYPNMYESLFLGGEHELSLEKYSYRKDLIENAQFFDPNEFYYKKVDRFWFDLVTIGCDYADGGTNGDDAATILLGFEFDKNFIVKEVYVLEENSINTKTFKDMTLKVEHIAEKISTWSKKYQHGLNQSFFEHEPKFRIGQDSRTVKDFLKKILVEKYNFNKEVLDLNFGIFISSGKNGWSIADRHYTWKRLLSEKKLFFSKNLTIKKEISGENVILKKHGHLYEELYKCLNHPDKNLRDERPKINKLDKINAAEHALSFVRFKLFEK